MASKEAKPIVGKLLAVLGGVSIDIYINIGSGGVSVGGGGVTTNFLYDGASILLEKQGAGTTATYTYGSALVRKDGEFPLYDGRAASAL